MTARKIRLAPGKENACPKCGATPVTTRTYSDTVDFRGLELDVEGMHDSKCMACGYVWASTQQDAHNIAVMRAAYAAERDRLRAAHGLLSGTEIAEVRTELGLNQREAASLFGGGVNAFNKYESGEVLQSLAMDRLLRLAKQIGKPVLKFLGDVNTPLRFAVISSPVSISNYSVGSTPEVGSLPTYWLDTPRSMSTHRFFTATSEEPAHSNLSEQNEDQVHNC